VWVDMDGANLAGPVPLSPSVHRGRIGLGSQEGPAEFNLLKAEEIPFRYVIADTLTGLSRDARWQTGAVLPKWFKEKAIPTGDNVRIKELLLAASQGIVTIPIIEAPKDLPRDRAEAFAGEIARVLGNPLVKPCVDRVALRSPDNILVPMIRAKGLKVIRIMSAAESCEVALRGARSEDGDMILVEGAGKDPADAVKQLLRSLPSERLIAPVDPAMALELGVGILTRPVNSGEGTP
jgi:hypothetical protein